MSIQRTATALWQRAPIWRGSVVAAGLCTVLAVVASMSGGGSPPQPPNYAQQPGSTQPSAPTRQAPTGSTGPVQMAHNPGHENVQRWNEFDAAFDAADGEARKGVRCQRLSEAFAGLKSEDLQFYRNEPKWDKQVEARRCAKEIEESDVRLAALEDAYQGHEADQSADKVERLARAYAAVHGSSFDESRNLSAEQKDALGKGADAKARVDASDARIQTLVVAADAAGTDPSPAALEDLARAAEAISDDFDRARMSEPERERLQRGQEAIDLLRESDARLAELGAALRLSRDSGDGAVRQSLIDAFSALVPLDRERASSETKGAIEEARGLAASFAADLLVETAATFDRTSSEPEVFERLRAQKALVDAYDGRSDLSPAQEAAYQTADFAVARLEESNRRLRAMTDAAEAWRRQPGPAAERSIRSAVESIKPFDVARMTSQQRSDHATVLDAHTIIDKTGKLTPANKDVVSIYVTAPDDQAHRDLLIESFRRALGTSGYNLVSARERAVLVVELDESAIDLSTVTIGSRTVDGAKAEIGLLASWAFDGSTFLRTSGSGDAASRSRDGAVEEAIADAVTDLMRDFDQAVQSGDDG